MTALWILGILALLVGVWYVGWRTWRIPFEWQSELGWWRALNRMLYFAVTLPMWSVVVNIGKAIRHPKRWWRGLRYARVVKERGRVVQSEQIGIAAEMRNVRESLESFVWRSDAPWYDWLPWMSTVLGSWFHDDCNGAAEYVDTRLEWCGVPAQMHFLYGTDRKTGKPVGHAVCVAGEGDERWVTSNGTVTHLVHGNDDVYGLWDADGQILSWVIEDAVYAIAEHTGAVYHSAYPRIKEG